MTKPRDFLHCSFCGKSECEVAHMIQGPRCDLQICTECVQLCADIVGYQVWDEREVYEAPVVGCRR